MITQKIHFLERLKLYLNECYNFLIFDYRYLTSSFLTKFRLRLNTYLAKCFVIKNKLLKYILVQRGYSVKLNGKNAIIFCSDQNSLIKIYTYMRSFMSSRVVKYVFLHGNFISTGDFSVIFSLKSLNSVRLDLLKTLIHPNVRFLKTLCLNQSFFIKLLSLKCGGNI
jgi:ribosomal protein L10